MSLNALSLMAPVVSRSACLVRHCVDRYAASTQLVLKSALLVLQGLPNFIYVVTTQYFASTNQINAVTHFSKQIVITSPLAHFSLFFQDRVFRSKPEEP